MFARRTSDELPTNCNERRLQLLRDGSMQISLQGAPAAGKSRVAVTMADRWKPIVVVKPSENGFGDVGFGTTIPVSGSADSEPAAQPFLNRR